MINFNNSKRMLTVFLCISISTLANASILWERDLTYDVNTNSSPLASCVNKDANTVIVITKVGPKGTFLSEGGDCVLWEIGINGNIVKRPLLKSADGNTIKTNAIAVGPSCAMASDNLGNLLTAGVLGEQRKEKSLAVISTTTPIAPNVMARNKIDTSIIDKLIPFQGDTFVLIGSKNNDGLCQQIDNQGKIIQEEQFDAGRNEAFTGVDWIKSHNLSLAIVGLSVKHENTAGMSGENFILLYDPNFKMIHEDYFTGWRSISDLSLVTLRPKVCYLHSGNIVVLYNKESTDPNDPKTRLWARCYTQELKLLWEKEIFAAEKSPDNKLPFYFDVISYGPKGFVSAIRKPIEKLEFYFFNEDGSKIGYSEYKGVVSTPGFNLIGTDDKIIAVFEEFSGQGKIKEITIKAKVIALD